MNEIWANRLIAGTKTWEDVPASRLAGVKAVLKNRVEAETLSAKQYETITGEVLEA